jgi:MFS family permease
VALFQVRLSRRADSVPSAARALVRGALWIAAGFTVVALADRGGVWFAVAALVAGSLIHVVGEMIGSGGQWGLQMGLAPHERQGQYQGFAGLGVSVMAVIGPPVVTFFCVEQGERGWLMLAVIMLVIALVSVPAARWALASRGRYGVTTHSG